MTDPRFSGGRTGGPFGRGPREDHAAEAPYGTPGPAGRDDGPDEGAGAPGHRAPEPAIDPELEEDLGAEYELRGDVMESELESARQEAADCRELALRTKAELENYRKRVQRDQADALKRAGERVVSELLPVIDNLERAIAHTAPSDDTQELVGGVEAVLRQFLDVLAKEGVTPIDPFGAQFDPHSHQAVSQQEDADVPEGTVVDVFQKGYEMHGRVVRPAMVIVATGGPPAKE